GKHVDEVRADDRVAADADTGALAKPVARELMHHLVRQRARPRYQTDRARLAYRSGNDAHLRLTRRDQAGAVRTDQSDAALGDVGHHQRHVEHGYTLGDAHNQRDPGVGSLLNRAGGHRRRYVDHRAVRTGRRDGFGDGVEHRNAAFELVPALPGRHPGHHVGAVFNHLPRVEGSLPAGNALHHEPRFRSDPDAHAAAFASATAFDTAASMSLIAAMPTLSRIRNAAASLVPVSRITIGTLTVNCLVAVTMPLATSSVRVMPPKMLNRITF